ncbi:serine/threonine-protein kinase HT1-like [Cucumis melo var. makuwa]|uniref:Serine/threonine-protein kinase HT1-like n=1 Tax=Cucumis melo var. makuwa TaxID=1194695 RepID=A0A5A7UUR2_CUCMM|nr:serine/threonine-protein kinase HT1-like [Cucumis melo var. makuwa]
MVGKGDTPERMARREARFAREVAMLSKVRHKNLVKAMINSTFRTLASFIGACKEPMMVIVTELLTGGTLRKFLLNLRPRSLELDVAIGFALDIARAMECLHSHGIIHRDLKPENLILTADHKTIKLADFGLAREESVTEMMTAETGTYRWMAPEVLFFFFFLTPLFFIAEYLIDYRLYSTVTLKHGDKKHYNHKVDAYSFAIVLWELILNRLPFEGMSNLQAAYAAAFKNMRPSAENLPEDLALIVTSCWREDPNTRPNFSQIIQMLLQSLSRISPRSPVIPPRICASENVVMPPESPGTNSLMAVRHGSGEASHSMIEETPTSSFFCFNKCY